MQDKKDPRFVSVRYIKGVGPKKSELFQKLGVKCISDLFYYLPRRYEDRSSVSDIRALKPGDEKLVRGTVKRSNIFTARTGTVICEIEIEDGTGHIYATWYNMPFMKKIFEAGKEVVLYGKVELQSRLQFVHPAYDIIKPEDKEKESLELGRIVPVYPLIQELSQKYMRKTVYNALVSYAQKMEDVLPTHIRARNKLVDIKFAVDNIHFPKSMENLERAYKRLVFEEFFTLQLMMAIRRNKYSRMGIRHEAGDGLISEFQELFEFDLTENQRNCIEEIEKDMKSERPMYRLLQGDVGSGKTVIALYAMLLAVSGGYQAVLMAPTEILARQHYVYVSKAFMPLGLNIRLFISGLKVHERMKTIDELARGEVDILIGTHSVFQEGVKYNDLGLVVVDEQHKFGVAQRRSLREKNGKADTLAMTATPIPRSLAITVYGDMDVSVLKGKPMERNPVTTYWVDEEKREGIYGFLKDELRKKRQAFIVCPRVKDVKGDDVVSSEEMFDRLRTGVLEGFNVGLVHGQMKNEDRDRVMKSFSGGDIDVLVASTVVEVGIDIPNATVMIIEQADRFGLAQLHQLRGRIGRGKHDSYCILISGCKADASNERLSTLETEEDGFRIAEKDLNIRGPGEFLGTRQSGLPELKFGDIVRDHEIMEKAREEAYVLLKEDPGLNDPRNAGIKQSIKDRFIKPEKE